MTTCYGDPVFDFDLNFLRPTPNSTVTTSTTDKQRKSILMVKKKIIATDALIKKYCTQKEALDQTEKKLLSAKEECKQICIDHKQSVDTCSTLEKDLQQLRDANKELELKCSHIESQYQAVSSHANQLQTLVKEHETLIEALKIENKLSKSSDKDYKKMIQPVQKENCLLIKHICLARDIIFGKRKYRSRHKTILKKYDKYISPDKDLLFEEDENNVDYVSDEIPLSPFSEEYDDDAEPSKDNISPTEKHSSNLDLSRITNNSIVESNDVASIDTGRGSSIACSVSDKIFHSPDYFINDSPLSDDHELNKIKTKLVDSSTSPIHFSVTVNVSTSPIIFDNDFQKNLSMMDRAISPIVLIADVADDITDENDDVSASSEKNDTQESCINGKETIEGEKKQKEIECLELNNSENISKESSDDCEIEMILSTMRLHNTLITPIPSTPAKSSSTSRHCTPNKQNQSVGVVCSEAVLAREENKKLQASVAELAKELAYIKIMLMSKSNVTENNEESTSHNELFAENSINEGQIRNLIQSTPMQLPSQKINTLCSIQKTGPNSRRTSLDVNMDITNGENLHVIPEVEENLQETSELQSGDKPASINEILNEVDNMSEIIGPSSVTSASIICTDGQSQTRHQNKRLSITRKKIDVNMDITNEENLHVIPEVEENLQETSEFQSGDKPASINEILNEVDNMSEIIGPSSVTSASIICTDGQSQTRHENKRLSITRKKITKSEKIKRKGLAKYKMDENIHCMPEVEECFQDKPELHSEDEPASINETDKVGDNVGEIIVQSSETSASIRCTDGHSKIRDNQNKRLLIRRQKLTKLQKLKRKCLPKYKIRREHVALKEPGVKPKLMPISEIKKTVTETDSSATLNDKNVYEKAVKVMSELKRIKRVCTQSEIVQPVEKNMLEGNPHNTIDTEYSEDNKREESSNRDLSTTVMQYQFSDSSQISIASPKTRDIDDNRNEEENTNEEHMVVKNVFSKSPEGNKSLKRGPENISPEIPCKRMLRIATLDMCKGKDPKIILQRCENFGILDYKSTPANVGDTLKNISLTPKDKKSPSKINVASTILSVDVRPRTPESLEITETQNINSNRRKSVKDIISQQVSPKAIELLERNEGQNLTISRRKSVRNLFSLDGTSKAPDYQESHGKQELISNQEKSVKEIFSSEVSPGTPKSLEIFDIQNFSSNRRKSVKDICPQQVSPKAKESQERNAGENLPSSRRKTFRALFSPDVTSKVPDYQENHGKQELISNQEKSVIEIFSSEVSPGAPKSLEIIDTQNFSSNRRKSVKDICPQQVSPKAKESQERIAGQSLRSNRRKSVRALSSPDATSKVPDYQESHENQDLIRIKDIFASEVSLKEPEHQEKNGYEKLSVSRRKSVKDMSSPEISFKELDIKNVNGDEGVQGFTRNRRKSLKDMSSPEVSPKASESQKNSVDEGIQDLIRNRRQSIKGKMSSPEVSLKASENQKRNSIQDLPSRRKSVKDISSPEVTPKALVNQKINSIQGIQEGFSNRRNSIKDNLSSPEGSPKASENQKRNSIQDIKGLSSNRRKSVRDISSPTKASEGHERNKYQGFQDITSNRRKVVKNMSSTEINPKNPENQEQFDNQNPMTPEGNVSNKRRKIDTSGAEISFMGSEHCDINESQSTTNQARESLLCRMIEQYGVKSVKFGVKKIPDSIINSSAKKIEDGIIRIIEVPGNEAKDAMNKFVIDIQNWNINHFVIGLIKYLKDPIRKIELFSKVVIPSAPALTKSEQILLYIISELKKCWNSVDIVDKILSYIEYTLFSLNRTPQFEIIESMSHFYAVVCRYFKMKTRLRLFVLDAMYCIQFKAIPLIRQCIEVWMHILPLAHMASAQSPLVTCLVYLLHFYKCEDKLNRVQEVRNILSRKYFYKITEWNETRILELCKNSIIALKDIPAETKMLRLALIILAKRHGPRWCHNNIIKNVLQPIIEKQNNPEHIKAFCVSMFGPLLKPYPADMKVHCEIVMNQLVATLQDNPTPKMAEAVVTSLLYMNKHNQFRVIQALVAWKQKNVSPELELMLKDFVKSKPLKIWKSTLSKAVQ